MSSLTTNTKIHSSKIAELLSKSIGQEKANEVVLQASKDLNIKGDSLEKEEALQILEKIGESPGLVGIVARLAKVRVRLEGIPQR
jgi:hypothetical protein